MAEGVDIRFGQWQKLAPARGRMRPSPLLVILDEAAAALDAETEHALFADYAQRRTAANLKTESRVWSRNRLSTVRMADHLVVRDGARSEVRHA